MDPVPRTSDSTSAAHPHAVKPVTPVASVDGVATRDGAGREAGKHEGRPAPEEGQQQSRQQSRQRGQAAGSVGATEPGAGASEKARATGAPGPTSANQRPVAGAAPSVVAPLAAPTVEGLTSLLAQLGKVLAVVPGAAGSGQATRAPAAPASSTSLPVVAAGQPSANGAQRQPALPVAIESLLTRIAQITQAAHAPASSDAPATPAASSTPSNTGGSSVERQAGARVDSLAPPARAPVGAPEGARPTAVPTRGGQLAELATLLERAPDARAVFAALRPALAAQSFRPGADARELRSLVRTSGPEPPTPPPVSRPEAVQQLARALEAQLRVAPPSGSTGHAPGASASNPPINQPSGQPAPGAGDAPAALPRDGALLGRALSHALETLAQRLPAAWTAETVAQAVRGVERELARVLRAFARAGAPQASEARAWSAQLAVPRSAPILAGREGAVARALTAFAHELGAPEPAAELPARADLHARLVAALAELESGALRESIMRAAQGLDVERLLGRLRLESEGEVHVSLPIPDGQGWAPLELFLGRRDPGGQHTDDAPQAEADDAWRVVVGVDFSRLGPVRADLWMRPDHVHVRLAAELPRTAQKLRQLAPTIETLLGAQGRAVRVAIVEAPHGEARVERHAHELRLLRDKPLMDVRG